MSPFNHQQKCLINGICGIFDMKSNHVGKVIPKSQKVYKNWIRGRLSAKNVFLKIHQKLHRYDQISGRRCLLSQRQMLSPGNDSWICWGYVYHRFWDFSISRVSQVVHVNFTSVHSVATSNTTIGHIWFPARTTVKLVLFFIRSTRTMVGFSQKLHRTETLSYRGWNHAFEAFTLPTRPKNQYQNKTLEWDTLRTYSPVWTLTF